MAQEILKKYLNRFKIFKFVEIYSINALVENYVERNKGRGHSPFSLKLYPSSTK